MHRGLYDLWTKGVLFPDPAIAPVMHCAFCGAPVVLVLNHEPVEIKEGAVLPNLVWGKDVSVVCMCCSYAGCPHSDKMEVSE